MRQPPSVSPCIGILEYSLTYCLAVIQAALTIHLPMCVIAQQYILDYDVGVEIMSMVIITISIAVDTRHYTGML